MHIEVITSENRLAELRESWNRLANPAEVSSVWFSHEWFSCWWAAFKGSDKLFVPTLWDDEGLRLVAPFCLRRRRLKGIKFASLEFLENGLTPRNSLIGSKADAGDVRSLLEELLSQCGKWRFAVLDNVEADGTTHKLLRDAAAELGLGLLAEPARQSPFIDLHDGYDAWFESLGRDMRRNIRRARRRLSEVGKLTATRFGGSANWQPTLERCFAVSARSWKGQSKKDLGGRPDRRRFFADFTQLAAELGCCAIWLLRLDDRDLAFEIHLERSNQVLPLAADYDQDFREHSPGVALRSLILESLAERGVVHYDFGGTVYGYKLQWTKQTRQHVRLWLFHNGWLSRLLYAFKKRLVADSGSSQSIEERTGE